jgi:hypothetical protein
VASALGDVNGAVGDALQVVVHFQDGTQQPQIAADRLIERHEPHYLALDRDFLAIDVVITFQDAIGEGFVWSHNGLARLLHDILDLAGHAQRSAPQLVQQVDEVYCHRAVRSFREEL